MSVWVRYAVTLCLLSTPVVGQDNEHALTPVIPAHSAGAMRALIEEGNQRYAQGDYAGALMRYRGARGAGGLEGSAAGLGGVGGIEAAYNEAVTLHAMSEGEQAKELLRRVEAAPDAGRLAAMARYNHGVIEYEQTPGEEGTPGGMDPQQRIGELESAERSFRRALDLDNTDLDSAKNLELTRREIEQLRQLMEQMQQQEQQDQDSEDQQEDQQDQDQQQQQQQQGEQGDQQQEDQQQQQGEPQDEESEQQQQEAQLGEEGDEEQDLAARLIEREEEMREEMRKAKREREPVEKDW